MLSTRRTVSPDNFASPNRWVFYRTNRIEGDTPVDGNGGPESARNFEVVAPGGEVVFIGATSGTPAPAVAPGLLIIRHAAARGFNLNVAERLGASSEAVDAQVIPLLQSGAVKLPIASVSPFDAIPELHRRFENREIQGRAVIEVGGEAVERLRRKG